MGSTISNLFARANKRVFPETCKFCQQKRTLEDFEYLLCYKCKHCIARESNEYSLKIDNKNKENILKKKARLCFINAHKLVAKAISEGKLLRPKVCSKCNLPHKISINAHHDDYLRPLSVRWLCQPCHRKWHRKNGKGLNSESTDISRCIISEQA